MKTAFEKYDFEVADEPTFKEPPENPRSVRIDRPNAHVPHSTLMKTLRYIELKSGHSDNGPAWIGYVSTSKTGRTVYFDGRGLMKLKGQRRGDSGGNYVDMETAESFWVSGVKKNGEDRHWAGSGKILVEAAAVSEYLQTIGAEALDKTRCEITDSIRETDVERLSKLANTAGKGWGDSADPYSFLRNVTLSPREE